MAKKQKPFRHINIKKGIGTEKTFHLTHFCVGA